MSSVIHEGGQERRRPLRVCHVAYTFYESDNRVRRYAETLADRGDEVDIVALRRVGQAAYDEHPSMRIFRVQQRQVTETSPLSYLAKILAFFIRATVLVSAQHLRRPYDLLHIHNVPDFLVFSGWLPKLMGSRLVLDIHDILPELYADKFGKQERSWTFRSLSWIERRSAHFADHVIVAGDVWRQRLIRRAGIKPARCTSIINYPNRNVFKPLDDLQRRRDGKFIMLYPGTLNHHQGVDIAVNAFALVRDRMPNAELHIYGAGPAKSAILALMEKLHLNGSVKLKPPVPLNEIARVMGEADLGLIPKRAEGFGNEAFSTKSLEFMACGVPIIMARTQVDSQFFDDSLVSFFEPGCPESLARAIVRNYEGVEERLGRASRAASFVSTMDWAIRRSVYLNIVDRVYNA